LKTTNNVEGFESITEHRITDRSLLSMHIVSSLESAPRLILPASDLAHHAYMATSFSVDSPLSPSFWPCRGSRMHPIKARFTIACRISRWPVKAGWWGNSKNVKIRWNLRFLVTEGRQDAPIKIDFGRQKQTSLLCGISLRSVKGSGYESLEMQNLGQIAILPVLQLFGVAYSF